MHVRVIMVTRKSNKNVNPKQTGEIRLLWLYAPPSYMHWLEKPLPLLRYIQNFSLFKKTEIFHLLSIFCKNLKKLL